MGSTGAEKLPVVSEADGSETTIEIKIKTLDSQTYTLKVDKQVPVPALKEQIASVTGVLSEQQRLICRGKVLKDDQLLSAYHVEDGHTLHMVVRQPMPPSSDGLHNHSGTNLGSGSQVSPSVVIETFNLPDQGDAVPPEISQIVSAVLGSFGFSNIASGGSGIDVRDFVSQRLERTSGATGASDSTQQHTEQAGFRFLSNRSQSAFGIPTAVSLGSLQPPVIPDSVTTLTQYLSHLRRDFEGIGRGGENNAQTASNNRTEERESSSPSQSGTVQEGLPTPASLAEVLRSSRQLLIEQLGDSLQQLAGDLSNHMNANDPSVRMVTQTNAWRTGNILQNLGAFLLELGRTTMTLRLGQTPSDAVVNAGPAVFISPTGPNPLMVQPLPFQPGTGFGAIPVGSVQPGSGLVNGRGAGFLPRRIDIQIRRGSPTATATAIREERTTQQPAGQRNSSSGVGSENLGNQTTSRNSEGSSFPGESGVRVVPIRTMVAAVPASFGRIPSDSSGNSTGVYYPVLGRFQHVASGIVSSERGTQASAEHQSAGVQTDRPAAPDSAAQQQNTGDPARNGSLPNLPAGGARSISISFLTAGGILNNQDSSERQLPNGVMQFLRNLFPGGEIQVEDISSQGAASAAAPEPPATPVPSRVPAASSSPSEPDPSNEGVFLSHLLQQIMPIISQTQENNNSSTDQAQNSSANPDNSNAGSSRRHRDNTDPKSPSPKRHKRE